MLGRLTGAGWTAPARVSLHVVGVGGSNTILAFARLVRQPGASRVDPLESRLSSPAPGPACRTLPAAGGRDGVRGLPALGPSGLPEVSRPARKRGPARGFGLRS